MILIGARTPSSSHFTSTPDLGRGVEYAQRGFKNANLELGSRSRGIFSAENLFTYHWVLIIKINSLAPEPERGEVAFTPRSSFDPVIRHSNFIIANLNIARKTMRHPIKC